jgi:uncharacterized protein (TIGR02569 family)
VSERPKEHASKACEVQASVGSNPTATANGSPDLLLRHARTHGVAVRRRITAMTPVPAAVLAAFGLPADGHPLPGGEGRSVRHGSAVLKPADNPAEAVWSARLLAGIEPRGFRLPRPLPARDGRWVVDGWTASEYVEGQAGPAGRWDQLLAAGRAFHAAVNRIPRPGFLDDRTHRWARADRAAWGEQTVPVPAAAAEHWARLTRLVRPVTAPCQLIHGDLTGNVLFAAGAPPAVLDFSPYWRPAGYADAIVVIDGLLWYGADRRLLSLGGADFGQLLVRALMFRLVALTEQARELDPSCLSELALFRPVLDAVERLTGSGC